MTSTMVTRKKLEGKKINNETSRTLNQLLTRSNITIKRKSLLENNKVQTTWKNVEQTNMPEKAKIEINAVKTKKGEQKSLLAPEYTDYFPDRRKRNVPIKKIVLEAKHDYKVVAATNKRKRRMPQREIKSPPAKVLSSEPELSMEDLIRMAEEQGMDDDDFMEILTCPSPVWWEEGSEDEELICVRLNEDPEAVDSKKRCPNNTINSDKSNKTYNDIICHNLKVNALKSDYNSCKKFIKKRSKLEKVLGNIKFKKTVPENDKNNVNKESYRKAKNNSGSELSDVSINEEDLLNTLENIEIPVQKIDNGSEDKNKKQTETKNERNSRRPKKSFTILNEPKKKKKRPQTDATEEICPIELDADEDAPNLEMVPTNLPPLTKKPNRNSPKSEFSSPKSFDSTTTETNSSAIEFGSISDTNVKFIDEYLDERNDASEFDDCTKASKNQEGELVTVYKILSNHSDDAEIEDDIKINVVDKYSGEKNKNQNNGKINSFYKTRKRTHRRCMSVQK